MAMGVTLPRGFEREKFDHASLMAMEDYSYVRSCRAASRAPGLASSAGRNLFPLCLIMPASQSHPRIHAPTI